MAMQGTDGIQGMGDLYNFSNFDKGNIFAAWGWGYTLAQMPGGMVAQLIGAKATWKYSMGIAAVASLCIPFGAALGGIYVVCFLSFLSGVGQGPLCESLSPLRVVVVWLCSSVRPD